MSNPNEQGAATAEDEFEAHFNTLAAERDKANGVEQNQAANMLGDEDGASASAPAPAAAAPTPAPAAPAASPAPAATTAPAAAPAPPKLEDLLQFVPADKADSFKAIVASAATELKRLHSDDGRVAAYQRRYGEEKQRADKLAADLAALQEMAKTATTAAERADVQEEVDSLAKEFPELSESINLRIKQVVAKLTPPPPAASQTSDSKPTPNADDAETTAMADGFAALAAAHPDYRQAVNTPAYIAWRERQPPTVRKAMASNDPQDAIFVLDKFKADLAQATQRAAEAQKAQGKQRLAENVGIKGTPARVTAAPDDYDAAFEYFSKRRSG